MSESVREVRWPRRAVNVATPSLTAEQKSEGADWDVFIAGRPHGSMAAEGGEALIRDGVWREVGRRVVASTGCEPIAEASGNVNVGVTVHCGCGVWTDDVRVASFNSSETPNSSTDWQPFDGEFRAGVEYRSEDGIMRWLFARRIDTASQPVRLHFADDQAMIFSFSENGRFLPGDNPNSWDITHQRPCRNAEAGEGEKNPHDFGPEPSRDEWMGSDDDVPDSNVVTCECRKAIERIEAARPAGAEHGGGGLTKPARIVITTP